MPNGSQVRFVGRAPITTTVGHVAGIRSIQHSLEMEDDQKTFNESEDIPVSWSIVNGKLKLFISHDQIESC